MPLRRVVPLVLIVLAVCGFCVELRVQAGGQGVVKAFDDLAQLAAALMAVAASAWRAHRSSGRLRWSWMALAAGASCWAAGETVWSCYELVLHRATPFPSLADAGYLMFPPLAMAGLLLRPASAFARHGRIRMVLDALLVAASLFIVSWVTALGQVLHAGADSPLATAVGLAYPVADLLLLTVALAVAANARASARLGLALLTLSFLFLSVGDSGFVYLTAVGSYTTGNLIDAGWVAGFLILAAAAGCDSPDDDATDRATLSRTALLLPYLPAAVGMVLAAYRVRGHHADNASLVAAVVIIGVLMARQLVVLTDNRRLVAQVSRQAFYDQLTGLANRALFHDRLALALRHQARTLRPVSVLLLDLDGFKAVNDTHGHAAGDELLARFAERLQGTVRAGDTVARLGGDEFAILTEGDGHGLADRLGEALSTPIRVAGHPQLVVASIGMAQLTADDVPIGGDELLDRADRAMYADKRRRRLQTADHTLGAAVVAELGQPPAEDLGSHRRHQDGGLSSTTRPARATPTWPVR